MERRVVGFVDVEMPLEDVERSSRRDGYAAVSIRRTWTHPLPEWSWSWPRWREHRPKWTWAGFHSEYVEWMWFRGHPVDWRLNWNFVTDRLSLSVGPLVRFVAFERVLVQPPMPLLHGVLVRANQHSAKVTMLLYLHVV